MNILKQFLMLLLCVSASNLLSMDLDKIGRGKKRKVSAQHFDNISNLINMIDSLIKENKDFDDCVNELKNYPHFCYYLQHQYEYKILHNKLNEFFYKKSIIESMPQEILSIILQYSQYAFTCDMCNEEFFIKDDFKKHENPKNNKCDICGVLFTCSYLLRLHNTNLHTN